MDVKVSKTWMSAPLEPESQDPAVTSRHGPHVQRGQLPGWHPTVRPLGTQLSVAILGLRSVKAQRWVKPGFKQPYDTPIKQMQFARSSVRQGVGRCASLCSRWVHQLDTTGLPADAP